MLRITAGTFKNRRLALPTNAGLRPTAERVREAFFSALESEGDLAEILFVDCFAGSGAMGIEALSRGVPRVVFVEREKSVVAWLRKTLVQFGVNERAAVIGRDLFTAAGEIAAACAGEGRRVIFCDPPYENHPGGRLLEYFAEAELLAPGSEVIVEAAKRSHFELPPQLAIARSATKRYGETSLHYVWL